MSELQALQHSPSQEHWALLAIARDSQTADRWQDALNDSGIQSEVRIADAVLTGRSSVLTQVNSPADAQFFSFAVWVPAAHREHARQVLTEAGWDGRHGLRAEPISWSFALRGALITLAIAVLLIIVQVART